MREVKIEKSKCCGCGLCKYNCPVDAITMSYDENGFYVPIIDEKKCIDCNKCINVCMFEKRKNYALPLNSYAAVRNDKEKLKISSSGGAFSAIAEKIIKEGGYVCGAIIDDDFNVKHIVTNQTNLVCKMYGSKYVQSDLSQIYLDVKNILNNGNIVLFSGTPCQVDAIKKYTNSPDTLYTIEIICHGVTPIDSFKLYVDYYLKKYNIDKELVREFKFRDKKQGWSYNNVIILKNGKEIRINHRLSSYMTYYLKGSFYRESCFICPYAKETRNSDLTIGDYWGFVRQEQNQFKINVDNGVSCCIANTKKGRKLLEGTDLSLYEVPYEHIKEGNSPLKSPSKKPNNRNEVMELYKLVYQNKDWIILEKYFKRRYLKFSYYIWSYTPTKIRHIIRVILRKR